MPAPLGNSYWQSRRSHGRLPTFGNPDKLWGACCGYFAWVEANPLIETEAFAYQGVVTLVSLRKMRAMTMTGLYGFLGIARSTWDAYSKLKDFSAVTTRASEVIRTQKFEGAAAGLLNPSIIARELGRGASRIYGSRIAREGTGGAGAFANAGPTAHDQLLSPQREAVRSDQSELASWHPQFATGTAAPRPVRQRLTAIPGSRPPLR